MAVTNFIWDVENDSYLMETDGSGQTQATYTSEPVEYGSLVSQERAGTTHYYHSDVVGSTRQLTDANEATTDSYDYTAFGESVAQSGSTTNPFRFWGKFGGYSDAELSNEVYIRRRHYLRSEGRWGSVDPLGFVGGANLYCVSRNVPVMLVDPSGLFCAPVKCSEREYLPTKFCRKPKNYNGPCCFPPEVSDAKPKDKKDCATRMVFCVVYCEACSRGIPGTHKDNCCQDCAIRCRDDTVKNCCAWMWFWSKPLCHAAVNNVMVAAMAYCNSQGLDVPDELEGYLPPLLPEPGIPPVPPPPTSTEANDK